MSKYVLPALPYEYDALEPHVSAELLRLHHDAHHAAYVKKANEVIDQMEQARNAQDFTRIASLERALAFNLSGHVLHSIFWSNLGPNGGGAPKGELNDALARDFGGFDRFKRHLTEVAATIMGSGWAALVWEPLGKRLLITQIYDHQSNLNQSSVPIMVLDAWEHAYYLQYQHRKTEFFDAIWNVWNWDDVARRLVSARKLDIGIFGNATK
jgi:Fe-Mn family superoxide dismutase